MTRGHPIRYSAAERAWVEAHRTLTINELHAAFHAAFGRADVSAQNLQAMRKREGWSTGRTGRFAKGQTPVNKGIPCEAGKGGRHPNARATQFTKGERRGVAIRLYKPIGSERLSKEGYLERKIHDGMPLQSRWRAVHLIRWEAVNGPVPAGMCLKCLSHKSDTDPANWTLVSRAMLPRLNGGRFKTKLAYDAAPPALKPMILAVAELDHRAREARKG